MNRLELLQKCIDFNEEVQRENYLHLIGLKEDLNETKIYERYPNLFIKENIKFIKTLLPDSSNLERRRNNFLLSYLISHYIGQKLSRLTDEASSYETKATVRFKDRDIPFRELRKLVANQEKKEDRDLIYEIEKPVKTKLLQYSIKILKTELDLIKGLGYKDYIELNSSLKDIDYFKLINQLKPFLSETDQKYAILMENAMRSINVNFNQATNYDYIFCNRSKKFDKYFLKEKVVETLKKTLLGMGFDLEKQKNIELDLEDRQKKVPRAFMMHIKVPEEIKLVIKPIGGHDDYHSILHESGHAEHYAHVNPSLEYEFKHFGDHSVTETFSFLFDNLMQDSNWLKHFTKMSKIEINEFVDHVYFADLYMFRRYLGKLIYELKLFGNDLRKLDNNFNIAKGSYKDFGECYSDILTKATKVKFPKNSYLLDLDGGFYVADYLKAWLGERQLRFKLRQDFGLEWFREKKTGLFLKKLYFYGNSKSIYELIQEIGFQNLDPTYIFKDFKDFLNKS